MFDTEQKTRLKKCLLYTLIFWLAAHGYRFLNNLYTGDTLNNVFQDDILWQRSLGRFLQPITMIFRGVITAPWLLFVIAVVEFGAAVFFLTLILDIKDSVTIFIICGVLSCNLALTCTNAAYTPWVDIYGIAFLLATLGVYLISQDKILGYILGILSLVGCMGFYQAYVDVAIGLVGIIIILELSAKKLDKKIIIKDIKMLGSVLLSGIIYAVAYKLVLKIHHVEEAVSYNSLSGVGDYEGVSIGELIIGVYKAFFDYLFHQGTFVSTYLLGKRVSNVWDIVIIASVIVSFAFVIIGLFILGKKNKVPVWQMLIQAVGLVILPLALNFVYILSKGMEHELMIYSFYLVYVFYIVVFLKNEVGIESTKWIKYLAFVPLVIIVWNNIVFSNQVYFKLDMEDRAALSISTRMINDIENMDGYEPGVTPVGVVGSLNYSNNYLPVIYLTDVYVHGNYNTPFNYGSSIPIYWQVYLNSNVNLVQPDVNMDIVDKMPNYPEEGSIQYVDDVLIIKLSPKEYQ